MTLIEAIKLTGKIPKKGEFDNGMKMELVFSTNHKGHHVATIWLDDGNIYDHIYAFAVGDTKDQAEDELMNKLLTPL